MTSQPYVAAAAAALRDELGNRFLATESELFDLYLLLVFATGTRTHRENVHSAWAIWRRRTRPDHPDLIPFDDLDPEVRERDEPYAAAIRTAAGRLAQAERTTSAVAVRHADGEDWK